MKTIITLIFLCTSVLVYSQNKPFEIGELEGDSTLIPQSINFNLIELVEKEIPQLGKYKDTTMLNHKKGYYSDYNFKTTHLQILDNGNLFVMTHWNGRMLLLNIDGPIYDQINSWGIITNAKIDSLENKNYFYVSDSTYLDYGIKFYNIENKYYLINPFIGISMNSNFTNFNFQYLQQVFEKSLPFDYLKNYNNITKYDGILFWDSTFRLDFQGKRDKAISENDSKFKNNYYVEMSKEFKIIKHFEFKEKYMNLSRFKNKWDDRREVTNILNYWHPSDKNHHIIHSIKYGDIYFLDIYSKFLSDSLNHKIKYDLNPRSNDIYTSDSIYKILKYINTKSGVKHFVNTPIGFVSMATENLPYLSADRCVTLNAAPTKYTTIGFLIFDTLTFKDTILTFRIPTRFSSNRSAILKVIADTNYLIIFDNYRIIKYAYTKQINNNSYKITINNSGRKDIELQITSNGYLDELYVVMHSKKKRSIVINGHNCEQSGQDQTKWYYRSMLKNPTFKNESYKKYFHIHNLFDLDSINKLNLPIGTYYFRTIPEYKSNTSNYDANITYNHNDRVKKHKNMVLSVDYYFLNLYKMPLDENEIIEHAFKIKIRRFGRPKITKIKLKKYENNE